MKKVLRNILKIIAIFLCVVVAAILILMGYLYFPRSLPQKKDSLILIAHRGVHHTFPFDNIENDTCTAQRIYPPTHEFFENSIPSIRAAFQYGADMVEIDIHPTTDNQLAVFHDWTIDCRTNGKGVTHEQNMNYLKTLDIGYGYTADGGKTFPLRGKGVGLIPTFEEVITTFPDKKFAINQKDTFDRTITLLAETLKKYPATQSANMYLFSQDKHFDLLRKEIPSAKKILPTAREEANCIPDYLKMLFTGSLSERCRNYAIGIPTRYIKFVPGWPGLFFTKARQAELAVYITDVDSKEEFQLIKDLPIDGIVTNRIEIIGPMIK